MGHIGIVAFLWLIGIDWPEPPSGDLDPSWQYALVEAHEEGRSFGNGIIFTAGPLGFLNSHYYSATSLDLKLWWECVGKLFLTAISYALALRFPIHRRIFYLVAFALFSGAFPDTFFSILLTLTVTQLLLLDRTPRWQVIVGIVLLAFLAQLKFTHLMLAAAGIGIAALQLIWQRKPKPALWMIAIFTIAFVGFWIAAGQNPVRLWDYLRYSWQISSGYPWAMAIDESSAVFGAGLSVAIFNLAILWRIWRTDWRESLPTALFLAAAWFVAWKHGFTRADGHVLAFFGFSLLVGIALPVFVNPAATRWWFDGIGVLCLAGVAIAEPTIFRDAATNAAARLRWSIHHLFHVEAFRINFGQQLEQLRSSSSRPGWRNAIGSGTVDLINYEQAFLYLNDLNYQPRHIPQSYSVYTPALMQKNAGYFRRESAPQFLVVRVGSIDNRFSMQDDAVVLAELPLRYDLAYEDQQTAIFRRKQSAVDTRELVQLRVAEDSGTLGNEVPVPDVGHPVWIRGSFPLSKLGRLRAFFYKPPQLTMIITDVEGNESRHRIIPSILTSGCLIQPLIHTSADYADFTRGRATRFARSIRFEPAQPSEAEYWRSFAVWFFALPELALTKYDPMDVVVSAGVANQKPVSVSSQVSVQYISVAQTRALIVHAPGEIIFNAERESARLTGQFGLAEGAYTGGGDTDGAEFAVEIEDNAGASRVLWTRSLDPRDNVADRGVHAFEIVVPSSTARIRLRTSAGTNANWDWTFWANIRFEP